MKKLKSLFYVGIISVILGLIFGIGFTISAEKSESDYFANEENRTAEAVPSLNHKVTVKIKGEVILQTTSGDYYQNKKYYEQKFGVGNHWREKHNPVEPKGIEYKPHSSVKDAEFSLTNIGEKGM